MEMLPSTLGNIGSLITSARRRPNEPKTSGDSGNSGLIEEIGKCTREKLGGGE